MLWTELIAPPTGSSKTSPMASKLATSSRPAPGLPVEPVGPREPVPPPAPWLPWARLVAGASGIALGALATRSCGALEAPDALRAGDSAVALEPLGAGVTLGAGVALEPLGSDVALRALRPLGALGSLGCPSRRCPGTPETLSHRREP